MKRLKKVVSYFLIAVLFSIALSGCGKSTSSSSETKKIVIWSFEDSDVWKPYIRQFEKENAGTTVTYQKQTLDSSYENRVLNSILSVGGPDIWAMPNDWVYRHKDKLTPRPTTTAIDINSFVPAMKKSVYFDDKIYALGPSAEPLIVYYNSDIFKKTLNDYENANQGAANAAKRKEAEAVLMNGVPTNWTDFTKATQFLTQKSGSSITRAGVAMGTDQISSSQDVLYLLMLQNETSIVSDDLKLATFNLPSTTSKDTTTIPGAKALEFYSSFSNPSSPNYSWNNSFGSDVDAFGQGKVAIIFGYDDLQNTLAQKYPNLVYKKSSMPQLATDSKNIVDFAKLNVFGVSNLSKNSDLAWKMIDMVDKTYNSDFNSATRLYTSLKASNYEISIENRQTINPEKNALATATTLIKGRYPVEFDKAIDAMIFSVAHGIQTPQDALNLTATNITDNYLTKTDW